MPRRGAARSGCDSHLSGTVLFTEQNSLLEVVGTHISGDIIANNSRACVVIADSSIQGDVDVHRALSSGSGPEHVEMTNTNVLGEIEANGGIASFDSGSKAIPTYSTGLFG
jgi:hypothetical protein